MGLRAFNFSDASSPPKSNTSRQTLNYLGKLSNKHKDNDQKDPRDELCGYNAGLIHSLHI